MKVIKIVALLSIALSHTAMADTVILKNGDWITGTVIKKETDQLIFKTKYAGEINILWSEIATLNTDAPVKVVLSDDSMFDATLQKRSLGRVNMVNSGLKMSTELNLQDVTYINPSPALSGQGIEWSGYANVGGAVTSGNTDNSQVRADAETIARTKNKRFTVGAYVNRAKAEGENTAFNSKGYMQYDYFLSKQWYLYSNGSLENDRFRDIQLRSSAGVGSGYQVYEQKELNLSIEGGINYISTDFNDADDERYASGRWALKYDQLVFQNVKFFHQHEVLFSLEEIANTLAFTKTGLRVPIAENLNASTQLNVDYANQPAEGREKTDKTLLFSVGYLW